MLRHIVDRSVTSKRIAVATCSDAFSEFLCHLLACWKFEICNENDASVILLAEEECAAPVPGQRAIWLTRSKYQGVDRLSLPLVIEPFWQMLEHAFHHPPRMHLRMEVDLMAEVTINEERSAVQLSSLSDMGCRFNYDRELVRDQRVLLALLFNGVAFEIESRVIYSLPKSVAGEQTNRVGLLFRGIDKDQRERLRDQLILGYLKRVQTQMPPERFAAALEKLSLPGMVLKELGY